MPDDAITQYILEGLDEPLICGSVPEAGEDELGILTLSMALGNTKDSGSKLLPCSVLFFKHY